MLSHEIIICYEIIIYDTLLYDTLFLTSFQLIITCLIMYKFYYILNLFDFIYSP